MTAAAAQGGFFSRPDVLIKSDAELCGALKDVKEFSEGQPQKRKDNRNGMSDREKIIGVTLHPGIAGRQQQSGDADRKQKNQGQKIFGK